MDQLDGDSVAMIGWGLGVLLGLGALLLIGAALVQATHAVHLSAAERTRWVLVVTLAPVFGALAWFAVGNRLRLR